MLKTFHGDHFSTSKFQTIWQTTFMNVLRSPDINLVPFVNVDNMMRLVSSIGIKQFLNELAVRIEQDFERCYVKSKLEKYPCFVPLDMLAAPDDPRDLFGMLVRSEETAK